MSLLFIRYVLPDVLNSECFSITDLMLENFDSICLSVSFSLPYSKSNHFEYSNKRFVLPYLEQQSAIM